MSKKRLGLQFVPISSILEISDLFYKKKPFQEVVHDSKDVLLYFMLGQAHPYKYLIKQQVAIELYSI